MLVRWIVGAGSLELDRCPLVRWSLARWIAGPLDRWPVGSLELELELVAMTKNQEPRTKNQEKIIIFDLCGVFDTL